MAPAKDTYVPSRRGTYSTGDPVLTGQSVAMHRQFTPQLMDSVKAPDYSC
jgi:hypothetical protein